MKISNKIIAREHGLKKLMHKLHIFDKDIKEDFVRSSGPGGQNVNKVSTCVVLRHIPTGIQVKCQESRSQSVNREKARHLLVKKIEKSIIDRHLEEMQKREKTKRKNRQRPGFLKEEILQLKHRRSEKKEARKRVDLRRVDSL